MYSMCTCTAPSNITAQRLHELKLLLWFYSTEPIFSNKLNNLNFFYPLTPKIPLVILLTVSYTIHLMLVWRI